MSGRARRSKSCPHAEIKTEPRTATLERTAGSAEVCRRCGAEVCFLGDGR